MYLFYIHKIMQKELTRDEMLEVNGGVGSIAEKILEAIVVEVGKEVIIRGYKEVVAPAINNFASKGSGNRGGAWEKYCPKC